MALYSSPKDSFDRKEWTSSVWESSTYATPMEWVDIKTFRFIDSVLLSRLSPVAIFMKTTLLYLMFSVLPLNHCIRLSMHVHPYEELGIQDIHSPIFSKNLNIVYLYVIPPSYDMQFFRGEVSGCLSHPIWWILLPMFFSFYGTVLWELLYIHLFFYFVSFVM